MTAILLPMTAAPLVLLTLAILVIMLLQSALLFVETDFSKDLSYVMTIILFQGMAVLIVYKKKVSSVLMLPTSVPLCVEMEN